MMKEYANVYDFDKTIYDGDSSLDFYFFCLRQQKKILLYMPKQIIFLFFYVFGLKSKKEVKQTFFSFIKKIPNLEKTVDDFWKINRKKIKKFYLEKKQKNDLIISASPEFLLKRICTELEISNLIATVIDKNGTFLSENCYGNEKVKRLEKEFPNVIINEMYTDSMSDEPLLKKSENGYLVSGNNLTEYLKYKNKKSVKVRDLFVNITFLKFLFIGAINTLNGVLLALIYANFFNEKPAFVFGYISSLTISYFLNSIFTFRDYSLSFQKYIKFCISYIPNFFIQLICVVIILDILLLSKLLAYTISAVLALPITFLALKLFVFGKKI